MAKIQYTNDVTLSEQIVQGSDGRLNVSSRSDTRAYYNSRDDQLTFSLSWDDASSATSDVILYWKNDDATGKHLVIEAVEINSQYRADFKLVEVTGTAAGGVATIPTCLNRAAPRVAQATARTADTTPLTGLTEGVTVSHESVTSGAKGVMNLYDSLRIGQDGAIAIVCNLTDTSPGRTYGTVYGFYE